MSDYFSFISKFLGGRPDFKAPLLEIVNAFKVAFPGLRKPKYYTTLYDFCKQEKLVMVEPRVYMLAEKERPVEVVTKSDTEPKEEVRTRSKVAPDYFLPVLNFLQEQAKSSASIADLVKVLCGAFPVIKKGYAENLISAFVRKKKLLRIEKGVYALPNIEQNIEVQPEVVPVQELDEESKVNLVEVDEQQLSIAPVLISESPPVLVESQIPEHNSSSKKDLIASARDFLKKAIVNILSARGSISHSDLYSTFLVQIESMLDSGELEISPRGIISLLDGSLVKKVESIKETLEVVPVPPFIPSLPVPVIAMVSEVVSTEENVVLEESNVLSEDSRMLVNEKPSRSRRPTTRSTELLRNDYLAYQIFRDCRALTLEQFGDKAREKRIPLGNISACITSLCDKDVIRWDKNEKKYLINPDVAVTMHASLLVDAKLVQDAVDNCETGTPAPDEDLVVVLGNTQPEEEVVTKNELRVEDFLVGIFLREGRRMRFSELTKELEKVGFSESYDTKTLLGRALRTMVDEEDRNLFQSVKDGQSGWEMIAYPKNVVAKVEESPEPALSIRRKKDRPINPKIPVLCNYFSIHALTEVTYKEMVRVLTDRKMLEHKNKVNSPISTLRNLGILSYEVQGSGKYQINQEELARWRAKRAK